MTGTGSTFVHAGVRKGLVGLGAALFVLLPMGAAPLPADTAMREVPLGYVGERRPDGKLAHEGEEVRVKGIAVVASGSFFSDRTKLFIQDSEKGLELWSRRPFGLVRAGDSIEAEGRIKADGGVGEISLVRLRVIGHGDAPVPLNVRPEELLSQRFFGRLVRMHAEIVRVARLNRGLDVELEAGAGRVLTLHLTEQQVQRFPKDLFKEGAELDVTGIASEFHASPFTVAWRLLPREPADVVVVRPAPRFTARQLRMGLGSFGGMVGLVLAWNISLGRQVRRRTQQYREAAAALAESEGHYRILFETTPQPMWVFDRTTLQFLAVNDAALSHYGYAREEFLHMTVTDLRAVEDQPQLERTLADGPCQGFQEAGRFRHSKKDGALIQVEIRSHALEMAGRPARLVLATDVTERLRLEEQLRQAHKMEAVGRLAGGVAHDFNNILNVIMGYAELMKRRLPDASPLRKNAAEILRASERAAALTRQLLAFSRKQVLQPKVLNLNTVVADMEKMLRRLIGEDLRLLVSPQLHLGQVKADPGQMEQVLMNLAVNARDAMPHGGSLLIETRNVELDDDYARSHAGARPGPHVLLAVSDTGQGMDAETQKHLFEPFFTTKERGKGTGLGLATVYGIVKQSEGYIEVYSEIGRGTSFKVYLPRIEEAVEPRLVRQEAAPPSGSETVLLVEDEEALRALTRQILEEAGYRVFDEPTPERALAWAAAHTGPIDMLLTDVVMPGMSGPELSRRLGEVRKDVRVLYMSGYTELAVAHNGVFGPDVQFLQKPFSADAILKKLREVLGAPALVGQFGG